MKINFRFNNLMKTVINLLKLYTHILKLIIVTNFIKFKFMKHQAVFNNF